MGHVAQQRSDQDPANGESPTGQSPHGQASSKYPHGQPPQESSQQQETPPQHPATQPPQQAWPAPLPDAPGTGPPAPHAAWAGGQPDVGQWDAEQLRQFRQFQQFQQFQRYTEAQNAAAGTTGALETRQPGQPVPISQPPWPVPPTETHTQGHLPASRQPARWRPPRWLKRLGGKLFGWFVFFVLIGLALSWAYSHFFGSEDEDRPAAETGGGTYHTNEILSTQPYEAVRSVYDGIAQNLVPQACGRMSTATQQRFATNMGFGDCRQAVLALHGEVTNVNDYAESLPSTRAEPVTGDTVRVSSCAFPVEGGRSLGAFTVTRVEKGQWLITEHQRQPQPCPPSPEPPPG